MTQGPALENPLSWGLEQQRIPQPCALVIFGATGDLTRRKLMPARLRLVAQGQLPAGFAVIGVSRRDMSDDESRELVRGALVEHKVLREGGESLWHSFAEGIRYVQSEFHDPSGYERLTKAL